ncbi:MAG TPA: hypothetical protein VMX55_12990, partial [candidate division Zixibacteria bacterium]|nr:hypothetical protein [candidate division Zixibacteria bacterium]
MELPVEIKHIIFPRLQDINGPKDTGFRILSAVLDIYNPKYTPSMEDLVKDCIDKKYNTFVITIGMMDPNENPYGGQYVFIGDFINDKKFGKQFKADFYYQDSPTTEEGLKAFLMFLPNIKEARSTAIIEKFGVEGTVQILDNDISRLMEIAGINEKRIPPIQKAWEEKKCLRELYGFFVKVGLPVTFADKI